MDCTNAPTPREIRLKKLNVSPTSYCPTLCCVSNKIFFYSLQFTEEVQNVTILNIFHFLADDMIRPHLLLSSLNHSVRSQQRRKPVEPRRPQTFRARRRPPCLGLRKFRLGIDERLFQRARKAVEARRDLARTNTHVGLSRAVPRIVFGRIRLEIRVDLHQRGTKIVVLRFELGAPVGRAVFGRQKVSLAKTPRFCQILLKRSREVERREKEKRKREKDRQS